MNWDIQPEHRRRVVVVSQFVCVCLFVCVLPRNLCHFIDTGFDRARSP